jgi:hypothetical protein
MLNGMKARRHRRSGQIEFVLWKSGESGHTTDFWARAGEGHEPEFVPDRDAK